MMDVAAYDQNLAALVLWREARGVPSDRRTLAFRGILHVITNRMADKRWPDTFRDVILQPYQFSSFNFVENVQLRTMTCDPNAVKWPLEKNRADWLSFMTACETVNNPGTDPTHGANHYHDTSIPPPFKAWLGKEATLEDLLKKKTVQIGPLVFYKI